jgi:hypothetical protein
MPEFGGVPIEAAFNYPMRDPTGVPPKINKTGYDDPTKETMVSKSIMKKVHNARLMSPVADLNKQGFQRVLHETDVNFEIDADIRARYYGEMEALVKLHTGAEKCILFDHTVRKVDDPGSAKGFGTAQIGGFVSNAVNKVHGDYTTVGAPRRVLGLSTVTDDASFDQPPLSKEEAQEIVDGGRRFMIVNVWRNTSRLAPVKRMPLGVMDCSSVNDEQDLFTVDLVFKERVGENLGLDDRPAHRWCYFPEMEFTEALLFKTFDSLKAPEITGRMCIHSAFNDPTTKPDDPTRESIEVRVLAIFPLEDQKRKRAKI